MVMSVPRAKIDATFSFDMRRYLESEKPVANPAGFPMVKLGDLYEVPKTIKKFNSGDMDNTGDSAFFNGKWDCPVGTHSEHSFTSDKDYFVIIKDGGGDHSSSTVGMGKFFKVNGKCSITSHNVILVQKKENDITHQYVYYYMSLNAKSLRDKARYSINLGSISMGDIMDFPIQLPPLPIQEEVVATLDRIYNPGTTELADTLKMTDKAMDLVLANPGGATLEPIVEAQRLIRKSAQMVADVKAQMVAVVKASMAGSGCTKYILSDLANDNPENLTKADKFETINYVDLGSVKEGTISTIQTIPFEEKPSRAQRKIQNSDIIWGGVRPLSRSYAFIDTAVDNMIGSSGFVVVRNKDTAKVLSKYLYYVLTTDDCVNYLNSHSTGSSYPAFNASTIMAYEVGIPSIAIQTKTLERLTTLQSQLTALESLQRQSEDNARFILESYLGSTGSSEVAPEAKESKEDAVSDSASPTNEIIHPEETIVVTSVKKVVKRKKPVVAKPLGGTGLDVITHDE
jgi:type I restriction enzyme S subunit